eukprot:3614672-Alexandrium_andersonii.AAC.1
MANTAVRPSSAHLHGLALLRSGGECLGAVKNRGQAEWCRMRRRSLQTGIASSPEQRRRTRAGSRSGP